MTIHLSADHFECNSELKYNVQPITSTDDITCSLCHGVNVTVSCHLIFIPKFHTKTWCSTTTRWSGTNNVLSKQNMAGTNARPQHVWTPMVGTKRPFCKISFKHNYLFPLISLLCVLYNINQDALCSDHIHLESHYS